MRHSIKTKTLLIAFIVLTTTTALGQANVLVEGYVQGIDTLVQVRVRVPTFAGDYEESVVVTGVERYQYDTQVSYPIGGQVYQTRWRVFMNDTGAYQYRRQSWINGAEQPLLADEFEVGVSYGLPLTKRNWACSVHTASTWYEASSKSSLGLRVSHGVVRPALPQYVAYVPSSYECQVFTVGSWWAAGCGPGPIDISSWSNTVQVRRNSKESLEYSGTNIEINLIYGKVKQ